MFLNIGVCEDDFLQRKVLVENIEKFLKLENTYYNIYEFSSGEELIEKYPPKLDIIFLDVQMKKISGIDAAKKIRGFDSKVEILFTTAVGKYVYDGYEVRAFRYLRKPITYDIISINLNSCILEIMKKNDDNTVLIDTKTSIIKLNLDLILYFETNKREVIVYEKDKTYNLKIGINELEKILNGKKFFRCHNSFIVSLKKINLIEKRSLFIDNIQIPVSKYRVKDLKKELTNCLGEIIC